MRRLESGERRGEQALPLWILKERVEATSDKLSFEELWVLQCETPLERRALGALFGELREELSLIS